MYFLSEAQKLKLKTVRSWFRPTPCALWTITKTGTLTNDYYKRPTSISSGSHFFSGSVAWTNTFWHKSNNRETLYRTDTSGGFYKDSDVTITCSLDEKSYINTENSYLVCEGVPLRMKNLLQATDTNEMVIFCERLNE